MQFEVAANAQHESGVVSQAGGTAKRAGARKAAAGTRRARNVELRVRGRRAGEKEVPGNGVAEAHGGEMRSWGANGAAARDADDATCARQENPLRSILRA